MMTSIVPKSAAAKEKRVFLHVGPSGDCWTGPSIFAAKHLQPDYIKSIPIPSNIPIDALIDFLEDNVTVSQEVYDTGTLSEEHIELLRCLTKPSLHEEDTKASKNQERR